MKYSQLKHRSTDNYGMDRWPGLDPELSFLMGKLLPENLPPLQFEVDYPDLSTMPHFIDGGIPVVSPTFCDALRSVGVDNFQLFPAKVVNPETGGSRDDYFAFNILGLLQAADMDASDSTVVMEGDSDGVGIPLVMFHSLRIDGEKAGNAALFRLAGSPQTVIINEIVLGGLKSHAPEGGWKVGIVDLQK